MPWTVKLPYWAQINQESYYRSLFQVLFIVEVIEKTLSRKEDGGNSKVGPTTCNVLCLKFLEVFLVDRLKDFIVQK